MTAPPDDRRRPAEHYENFPVASWLCPPRLRPPIAAIYWYARTADDIADEGSATAAERLAELAAYRMDLVACLGGNTASERWPGVFQSLARAVRDFQLPPEPLLHLLDAFVQDVEKTRDGAGYPDRAALLGYCRLSANPIGRLLLHLYGVHDATALVQSDAICSALQLINFWQDLSVDLPRGRYYLPEQDCRDLSVDCRNPGSASQGAALVGELCDWSRELMLSGAPLVHRVPGRAGWELRLVVQGGLRILDRIQASGYRSIERRPRLSAADALPLLWRSARM